MTQWPRLLFSSELSYCPLTACQLGPNQCINFQGSTWINMPTQSKKNTKKTKQSNTQQIEGSVVNQTHRLFFLNSLVTVKGAVRISIVFVRKKTHLYSLIETGQM